ncbi:hypothetical protein [Yersinia enterocolitica]|uniref:hypothetical protein n=1 Tax=Yersinia enterocolitica TaxID=630 RepID=UPI0002DA8EF3|nr:hypothetical protein [Yersinia enterocolitica]
MSLIRGSPYGPAQALFKVVYNQFVSHSYGPAQALFKVVYNQFVSHLPPSCNSNLPATRII